MRPRRRPANRRARARPHHRDRRGCSDVPMEADLREAELEARAREAVEAAVSVAADRLVRAAERRQVARGASLGRLLGRVPEGRAIPMAQWQRHKGIKSFDRIVTSRRRVAKRSWRRGGVCAKPPEQSRAATQTRPRPRRRARASAAVAPTMIDRRRWMMAETPLPSPTHRSSTNATRAFFLFPRLNGAKPSASVPTIAPGSCDQTDPGT